MGPNFGEIKYVVPELFSLLGSHRLYEDIPDGEVTLLDVGEEFLIKHGL